MPAPSFEATLFDYLRIIFHRWQWIIGLLLISVGMSWLWVEYVAPKRYRSNMVVLVWSRDMTNSKLRRFFSQAPLAQLLMDIRSRLQIESRLRRLTCNLRYGVKRDYLQNKLIHDESFLLHPAQKSQWRTALREELENFPRYVKRGSLDMTVMREDFVKQIDTQSLTAILTGYQPDPSRLVDQMLLQEKDQDPFFSKLRDTLFEENETTVTEREVRAMAEKKLLALMESGVNEMSDLQVQELLKEFLAQNRLADTNLYFVVGDYYNTTVDHLEGWVGELKGGLVVSAVKGNQITFEYSSVYNSPRNVIADVVVRVVFAMMEAEFRYAETRLWDDTYGVIYKARKKLQSEINELNKDIYNFEKLTTLQLSFVPLGTEESEDKLRKTANWSDPFTGLPNTSTHIQRIDRHLSELRTIEQNVRAIKSVIQELEMRIADPERRVVRIERQTQVGEAPEVTQLRTKIIALQLEMSKLLRTRTPQHPQVVRMQRELNEMESAMRALRGQGTLNTGKEVEIKTNPQVQEWQEKLDSSRLEAARLQEMGKMIGTYIEEEKQKAAEAILQQREYRNKLDRQKILNSKLSRLVTEEEEIRSQERAGKDFRPMFEVYTDSRRPGAPYDPKKELVLLMGLLVGFLAAATGVFMLEYTDHSIKTAEDIRRFIGIPVLGEIPEFSFGEMERQRREQEMGRRVKMDSSKRLYHRDGELSGSRGLFPLVRMGLILLLIAVVVLGLTRMGISPVQYFKKAYVKIMTMLDSDEGAEEDPSLQMDTGMPESGDSGVSPEAMERAGQIGGGGDTAGDVAATVGN